MTTYLSYTSNDIESVIIERDELGRDIKVVARIRGNGHEEGAQDYLAYVDGKIEIKEEPLSFDDWCECIAYGKKI